MREDERNSIIALCANVLDKEAAEWNTIFFDFLDSEIEDASDYAMTKAMAFQDAAEMVRELSPDYKEKKDAESVKVKKWAKSIRENNPIPMPQLKDH